MASIKNAASARQLVWTREMADRLAKAVKDHIGTHAQASEASGVPKPTVSKVLAFETEPKAATLAALASAAHVTTEYIFSGRAEITAPGLIAVDEADWVFVPEVNLREITDTSPGPVVSRTPFRRDWLNRFFGRAQDVWLTALPADYPSQGLREGELMFASRAEFGDLSDRGLYVWRAAEGLKVARYLALEPYADRRLEEPSLWGSQIGLADGQAIPVVRILGAAMKRV